MKDIIAKLPELVPITSDMKCRAWQFANDVVGTVDYQDHKQNNTEKIIEDHCISKLGEEAVYQVCTKYGLKVDKAPDYTIYEGKAKSWESDLIVCGEPVAVKTQRKAIADMYSLSWTFASGGRRIDPILQQPAHLVAFVEYFEKDYFNLGHSGMCVVLRVKKIGELTFDEPAIERLKDVKKVVYYQRL